MTTAEATTSLDEEKIRRAFQAARAYDRSPSDRLLHEFLSALRELTIDELHEFNLRHLGLK